MLVILIKIGIINNYRDSDINDFHEAIEYIVDQGGFVVRMGSEVEKSLDYKDKNVIDYAKYCRTDFMDIYLISKCKFFLGTTAGICDVAVAMNKPKLSVNYAPFGISLFGKDCVYIPKKLKNKKNGVYLSLYETLKNEFDKDWDR